MAISPLVQSIKGKLIVSVQAYPGEPLRHPETMAQMARACELGGAAAIRCQGLSDIAAIKGRCDVPVIGLWKEGHEGVYITPTLRHAVACVNAGADVVALDAFRRPSRLFAQVGEVRPSGAYDIEPSTSSRIRNWVNPPQDSPSPAVGGRLVRHNGRKRRLNGSMHPVRRRNDGGSLWPHPVEGHS